MIHKLSSVASSLYLQFRSTRQCCSTTPNPLQSLLDIVSCGVGSLQDLESSLDRLKIPITQSLVTQVIGSSTNSRRLLRFFSWCQRNSGQEFGDEVFNYAIRALSQMKDATALEIAILDMQKEGKKLDKETFANAAETFVKLGKPEKAVSLFRDIEEKNKLHWRENDGEDEMSPVTAAVHALCAKGYARKALGILWHHKDKVKSENELHHHKSLVLHGWSVRGNAKEARRVLEEMKSSGYRPSLASYHDLLRCVCKRNLKFNPSGLVPEAMDLMTEMRSSGISPTAVTFNILLSCLGKRRRVKESCRIILSMIRGEEGEEAAPDSASYYIVIRLLYLTERFSRGEKLLNRMIEEEDKGRLTPRTSVRFYHGLIGVLCGVEKMEHALNLFERMKERCCFCLGEENKSAGYDCRPTYDLLISKLCRNGKFDLGRNLWDEAIEQSITPNCSRDLLDPLTAPEVFNPMMKIPVKKISKLRSPKKSVVLRKKDSTSILKLENKNKRKKKNI